MPGVVCHRRIRDTVVGSCANELREPGQHAVHPGAPAVDRRRPRDDRAAAIEKAARLKGSDNRRSVRETVGLDLCSMLTRRIGKRIGAQLQRAPAQHRSNQDDQPGSSHVGPRTARPELLGGWLIVVAQAGELGVGEKAARVGTRSRPSLSRVRRSGASRPWSLSRRTPRTCSHSGLSSS